jgi:hypothetical protein
VTVAVIVLSGGLLDDPGHGGAGLQPFLVAIGYAATSTVAVGDHLKTHPQ